MESPQRCATRRKPPASSSARVTALVCLASAPGSTTAALAISRSSSTAASRKSSMTGPSASASDPSPPPAPTPSSRGSSTSSTRACSRAASSPPTSSAPCSPPFAEPRAPPTGSAAAFPAPQPAPSEPPDARTAHARRPLRIGPAHPLHPRHAHQQLPLDWRHASSLRALFLLRSRSPRHGPHSALLLRPWLSPLPCRSARRSPSRAQHREMACRRTRCRLRRRRTLRPLLQRTRRPPRAPLARTLSGTSSLLSHPGPAQTPPRRTPRARHPIRFLENRHAPRRLPRCRRPRRTRRLLRAFLRFRRSLAVHAPHALGPAPQTARRHPRLSPRTPHADPPLPRPPRSRHPRIVRPSRLHTAAQRPPALARCGTLPAPPPTRHHRHQPRPILRPTRDGVAARVFPDNKAGCRILVARAGWERPGALHYTSPIPKTEAVPLRLPQSALSAALIAAFIAPTLLAQNAADKSEVKPAPPAHEAQQAIQPDSTTEGSVNVEGKSIAYRAVAGILTVGSNDVQDSNLALDGSYLPGYGQDIPAKPEDQPATARMYYVAYFMKDAPKNRPITFLYNGGPGSPTMYLHMGAFGPVRVVTPDVQHQEGAPYSLISNQYSLLDASDLVFIDAPGTGFSRVLGKDAGKAFWGTDEDGHAFDRFIRRFLTKYDRWNSPKFLFGESYGTTRTAVLT